MTRSTRTLVLGATALVAVALVIALAGGGGGSDDAGPTGSTTTAAAATALSTTSTSTSTTTTAPTTTIDPRVDQLVQQTSTLVTESTPEELAYRLVVTGLTGDDLGGRLEDTVGSVCVGGIFLTESNGNWEPADDREAYRDMRNDLVLDAFYDSGCEFGPLLATDAELGSVVRVPVESPAAAPAWTERYVEGDPYNVLLDLQEEVATYASELRDLGIDVNFGAVADVSTSSAHFMAQQGRTFGDDPGTVAALANAVVQAHCAAGVAPTLKHFPNQGDTAEDPHAERSTAVGGRERWESTGRWPYEDTAAPVVMTGHIFMTDVDPDLPASMSPLVTNGLLRGELGYDGVVITDDLSTMRGASAVIPDPGDRAVAAIRAGADLVLFVDDRDVAPVIEALTAEMEADDDFLRQAREAFRRILRLHLGLREPELFPLCPTQG